MKPTAYYVMLAFTWMVAFLSATSGELRAVSPEEIRLPEDLMYVFEQPPLYGTKEERADFWAQQKKKILETPNITNRLYEILWPSVEAGRLDLFQMIFSAFSVRGDLSPEQLRMITARMKEKATSSVAGTVSSDQSFVECSAALLGRYPSTAHEDLLLPLLKIGDEWWARAAAISLGKIGTRRSIEPLRKLVKMRAERVDPKMRDAAIARYGTPGIDPVAEALLALERRVKTLERKSSRGIEDHQGNLESEEGSTNPAGSKSSVLQNKSVLAISAGLVFIAIAMWRILRRKHGYRAM